MSVVNVTDIREFLEGYNVTTTILSDAWIQKRIDNSVVPFIENRVLGYPLESEREITEYISGTGEDVIILSHRPVSEIVRIEYVTGGDINYNITLGGIELIQEEGIIKSIQNIDEGRYNTAFSKGDRNIKITYKIGLSIVPEDIKEAVIYLASEQLLGFIGARTGGGSLNVEGFGRGYGARGKYQDIRNDLKRQAMGLLKNYMTNVIGNTT